MKVTLTEEELSSPELSWLCIKPMLLEVRAKDVETTLAMYRQLTEGQQALYLFYAFHNHVNSIEEFYGYSVYYVNELKSWDGMKKGVRYFRDVEMAELLERIEALVARWTSADGTQAVPLTDLANNEALFREANALFEEYKTQSVRTIARMNQWIMERKEQFIE